MILSVLDFLVDHLYISTLERQITRHEYIEYASERPDITLIIIITHNNLRRLVVWCTSDMLHLFVGVLLFGEAKIDKFELIVFV